MSRLEELNGERWELYRRYRAGEIDQSEYHRLIKPLDEEVDRIELGLIGCSPLWGKEPSTPPRSA